MKNRTRIGLLFLIALILSTFFSHPLIAAEISGVVFEDPNKNLKFDPGEKGIKGILVSNQRDVALTDSKGHYSLPLPDETVIFVTKPAGYALPLDKDNLPQFYYIHQPKGSPPQKYRGVEPTGALPQSLNFPLFKSKEPDSFEAIILADTQSANLDEIAYMRDDVVSELVGSKALCGMTLGDVTFDDLSLYDPYKAVIAAIGIPWYNIPGNHDENYDSADDRYALETYKRNFGAPYYSFDYGKVHFVALDDVEWHGKTPEKKGWYRGMIGEKQLEWLKNDLALVPKNKLVVLTMHIPIKTVLGSDQGDQINDRATLFEILKDREHVLVLAGHNHTIEHQYLGADTGWKGKAPLHQIICAAVCGSWWGGPKDERGIPVADQYDGTPNGYHIIRFDGTAYGERFKPSSRGADFQLRISSPAGKISKDALVTTQIVVNIFDAGPDTVGECQLDGAPALKMQKTLMDDPFFLNLVERNKDTFRSWVHPQKCTHIWTTPLPQNLSPGLHKIAARTTDQFGNSYKTTQLFEVE